MCWIIYSIILSMLTNCFKQKKKKITFFNKKSQKFKKTF